MKGEEIPINQLEETLARLLKIDGYLMASVKYDGYRCRSYLSQPWSSTAKLIRNRHIQEQFKQAQLPDGLDGELVVDLFNFQRTQSGVTSAAGKPDFKFYLFDWDRQGTAHERYFAYNNLLREGTYPVWMFPVTQQLLTSISEVLEYEQLILEQGHEGVMLRLLSSPYKHGRATLNEGYLLKLVRFHTAEAVITGYYEQEENGNFAISDQYGKTKRSSSQDMKFLKGTLGGFYVRGLVKGVEQDFKISGGKKWTDIFRARVWRDRESYIGRTITYTYKVIGTDKRPRTPQAKGFL